MTQQYDLISLRSFIAVVDTGSFNQAAQLLDTSTAAVSRRVSSLESALDVKLLHRTTRKVELTEAGQHYYQDIVEVFHSLDQAKERVQTGKDTIKGNLRISAPLSFGLQALSPILSGFMSKYPELNVHLQLEDSRTDFVAEAIDVGIRVGFLEDSSLVAVPITEVPIIFAASKRYLAQHGEPKTPKELLAHNCLRYSLVDPKMGWPYCEHEQQKYLQVTGTLTCNNGNLLKEAAVADLGIVLSPKFIIEDALISGELIEILSSYRPKSAGLYAIKLSRKFTPAKVSAFINYLKVHFT